jgi:hypothetical protein
MAKKIEVTAPKEKQYLPCALTPDEERMKGKLLSAAHSKLKVLEQRKKEFNDQNKSLTSGVEAEIETLSQQIASGIEHRDITCHWEFDTPQKGDKTLIREDTEEIVRIEEMTHADLQKEFEMD